MLVLKHVYVLCKWGLGTIIIWVKNNSKSMQVGLIDTSHVFMCIQNDQQSRSFL